MIRYPHIAARIFNTPLLILPGKLDAIIAGLGPRFGLPDGAVEQGAYTTATGKRRDPGYRVVGSVGVVDIFGVLAHRGGIDADSSYILGYQDIARRFEAAMEDPAVSAVVLNLDTPGGEVAGAFDLHDQIRAARGRKPIHAVASDLAASAGYLIASAADEVSITRTGYAGSVGVVMRHVDFSRALDAEGIRVTHVFAGAHKVDGNPYEPLPEEVRAQLQAEVERTYGLFTATVAASRGLKEGRVRATEAQVYMGELAVEAGLADRVETPDALIARLQAGSTTNPQRVSARTTSKRKTAMSEDIETTAAETTTATFTQADLDRARAEGEQAGASQGAGAERERIRAIVTHEQAAGRAEMALSLALDTELDAEAAGKVLATAPKAETVAGSPFVAAMAALGNPEVGADTGQPADESAAIQAGWNRALKRA